METSHYARFIRECITADIPDNHGLTEEQLYGVYLSWCSLDRQCAASCDSLRTAMSALGHQSRRQNDHDDIWPGLRMTGPAALDYILTSRPSLV